MDIAGYIFSGYSLIGVFPDRQNFVDFLFVFFDNYFPPHMDVLESRRTLSDVVRIYMHPHSPGRTLTVRWISSGLLSLAFFVVPWNVALDSFSALIKQ